MAEWHGNDIWSIGLLYEESTSHRTIPLTEANNAEIYFFTSLMLMWKRCWNSQVVDEVGLSCGIIVMDAKSN